MSNPPIIRTIQQQPFQQGDRVNYHLYMLDLQSDIANVFTPDANNLALWMNGLADDYQGYANAAAEAADGAVTANNAAQAAKSASETAIDAAVAAKNAAESAQANAATSANTASTAAGNATTAANNAELFKQAAAGSANAASNAAAGAASSAANAGSAAQAAAGSAAQAATSASSMPIIRLTKNQALIGSSGSAPTGWTAHPSCTLTNICNVGSEVPTGRHPIAQELLNYIGINHVMYFGLGFNIWRIGWTASTPYLMFQFLNLSNPLMTVAAYTKLESGQVGGCWAEGATNTWKLTGQQAFGGMMHQYWMLHPTPISSAGSLLFALPAAVTGKLNLSDPQQWALYPYIGDQQYD